MIFYRARRRSSVDDVPICTGVVPECKASHQGFREIQCALRPGSPFRRPMLCQAFQHAGIVPSGKAPARLCQPKCSALRPAAATATVQDASLVLQGMAGMQLPSAQREHLNVLQGDRGRRAGSGQRLHRHALAKGLMQGAPMDMHMHGSLYFCSRIFMCSLSICQARGGWSGPRSSPAGPAAPGVPPVHGPPIRRSCPSEGRREDAAGSGRIPGPAPAGRSLRAARALELGAARGCTRLRGSGMAFLPALGLASGCHRLRSTGLLRARAARRSWRGAQRSGDHRGASTDCSPGDPTRLGR